jgi:hypothetical protein
MRWGWPAAEVLTEHSASRSSAAAIGTNTGEQVTARRHLAELIEVHPNIAGVGQGSPGKLAEYRY